MLKEFKKGFTLAEVLIVIGIIGVVAALTLPNLNHATGDKETVTRLQKAYSILNEANDRAVAIYGPISTWSEECRNDLNNCWMKRVGEFLKISKSCDESEGTDSNSYVSCEYLRGNISYTDKIYQLSDGMTFAMDGYYPSCKGGPWGWIEKNDMCSDLIAVDINGPSKGKNEHGKDIFRFELSDSIGLRAYSDFSDNIEDAINTCISNKEETCSFWVLEYGNLDYLKADESGKCNDSNIILDGTTNTSCH